MVKRENNDWFLEKAVANHGRRGGSHAGVGLRGDVSQGNIGASRSHDTDQGNADPH
ncbi:hypothetical protein DF3PB_10004 [uncultured Defluviicoccus sp.]|uniref:Uncharacterized protein n=1 Tax=metagenome TaxID=256318 RepID=A0A380T846_9ZZZZ|nr:hypothetical protein DF3PB_10004 [uncultured Defluviicoccus sp.]